MSAVDHRKVALAFGAVLRTTRKQALLSQEDIAERAGLDRTTPSLYERGLRQPPIASLIALGHALGCDPAALVRMTVVRLREPHP
jgi:transcriptional regulator with XRE-family HTH domain